MIANIRKIDSISKKIKHSSPHHYSDRATIIDGESVKQPFTFILIFLSLQSYLIKVNHTLHKCQHNIVSTLYLVKLYLVLVLRLVTGYMKNV